MFATNYVQCWSKKEQAWKPGQRTGTDEHNRCLVTVRVADPNSPDKYDAAADPNDGNYIEKEIYLYPTAVQDSVTPWVVRDLPAPTMTWNLDKRMSASLDANRKSRTDLNNAQAAAIAEAQKKASERDYIRKQLAGTWEADVAKKAANTQADRDARRAKEQQDLENAKSAAYQKISDGITQKERDRLNAQREHDKAIRKEELRRANSREDGLAKEAEELRRVANTYGKINNNITNAEAARQQAAREHDASIRKLNQEKEERRRAELQRQAEAASATGSAYEAIQKNLQGREAQRQQEQAQHMKDIRAAEERVANGRLEALEAQAAEQAQIADTYAKVQDNLSKREAERRAEQAAQDAAVTTHQKNIAAGRQATLEEQARDRKAMDDSYSKLENSLDAKEKARQRENFQYAAKVANSERQIEKERKERRAHEEATRQKSLNDMNDKINSNISSKEAQRLADQNSHNAALRNLQGEIDKNRAEKLAAQQKQSEDVASTYQKLNDGISNKQATRMRDQNAAMRNVKEHEQRIADGRAKTVDANQKQKAEAAAKADSVNKNIQGKEAARRAHNRSNTADFNSLQNAKAQKAQERQAANEQAAANMAQTYSKINSGIDTKEASKRADEADARQKEGANNSKLSQVAADKGKQNDDELAAAALRAQAYRDEKAQEKSSKQQGKAAAEAQLRIDEKARKEKQKIKGGAAPGSSPRKAQPISG